MLSVGRGAINTRLFSVAHNANNIEVLSVGPGASDTKVLSGVPGGNNTRPGPRKSVPGLSTCPVYGLHYCRATMQEWPPYGPRQLTLVEPRPVQTCAGQGGEGGAHVSGQRSAVLHCTVVWADHQSIS